MMFFKYMGDYSPNLITNNVLVPSISFRFYFPMPKGHGTEQKIQL